MLFYLDKPKIALSEGCTGVLTIDGIEVCYSEEWKSEDSHKVCQELGCGNAIHNSSEQKGTQERYHVQCDDHHYKFSQCKRVKVKNSKCESVSIHCYSEYFYV